jgi:hypothetical protein
MAEETQSTDGTYLSLFMFLIITVLYYVGGIKPTLKLDILNAPTTPQIDEKGNSIPTKLEEYETAKTWSLVYYILLILVTQYSVNSYVLIKKCGGDVGKNMITAIFMTLIPWFLIFGAVVLVIFIFPGFKSAFSNVIGYFAVASQANTILTTLLKNTAIQDKIDNETINNLNNENINNLNNENINNLNNENINKKKELEGAAEAILKLCGNTGILINQISPDNFTEYWELLNPLIKSEFKSKSGIEINSEGEKLKEQLLGVVCLRDNIGEALWYIYTAVLLISIIQMNITTRGCQQDAAAMESRRQAYLESQAKYTEQQEKLKSQAYTI